ncbi:hypothetical protein [Brevibacillus sp. MER 51]|uniref:hypothetical protein n=1 Tax=Brevibacillus sp. MER 51 TaxID=2939560 RepID=UPI00203DA5D7|nr:hypothetical protein [Brevibacillus sp. MER 51]MCM3144367.1 hypothetical protein [Brevibacillus sp. MER 51]
MNHRMNDQIVLKRTETVQGERNIFSTTELPPHAVLGCVRAVESAWQRPTNTDPVEWDYKATLGFLLGQDVRKDDRLDLPNLGEFVVVDVRPGRRFLAVTAIQQKRGAE